VYHAASAGSYPQRAPASFDVLRKFWVDNPPPFALPFARQVGFIVVGIGIGSVLSLCLLLKPSEYLQTLA
jgi:hypothetical protein